MIVAVQIQHYELAAALDLLVTQLLQQRIERIMLGEGTRDYLVRQRRTPDRQAPRLAWRAVHRRFARPIEVDLETRASDDDRRRTSCYPATSEWIFLTQALRVRKRHERLQIVAQGVPVVNRSRDQRPRAQSHLSARVRHQPSKLRPRRLKSPPGAETILRLLRVAFLHLPSAVARARFSFRSPGYTSSAGRSRSFAP